MLRYAAPVVLLALVLTACAGNTASSPLTEGRSLYANNCSVCHGSAGDGATAPSLKDVQETFPSCDDHIEWVSLGSENWRQVHGETYGATDKPIDAVMPAHGDRLTAEEIALVSSFERIQYGGMDEAAVFEDCAIGTDPPETP